MFGIFGGSFDPVHNGHLEIARCAQEKFHFSTLWFIPCGQHAFGKAIQASAVDRVAMLSLALAQNFPTFQIDTREIDRKEPSYAIDTLREIRKTIPATESLAFILGLDALYSLPRWKDWQDLLAYAHLIVANRISEAESNPPMALQPFLSAQTTSQFQDLKNCPNGKIYYLDMPLMPVSSTQVRKDLEQKHTSEHLPKAVLDYITEHAVFKT